jgi:tRNA pseudouridine55 synthase
MFGLLNVDKPPGATSRDIVNRVQRLVRPVKVGHAGTLDPLATGVLVIGLGPATRLVEYVQRMRKVYLAEFLLGRTSDTEDIEGTVVPLENDVPPTREQIEAALPRFTGRIEQVPPAFSALKIQGKRAYDLARKGHAVDLKARPVQIHHIGLLDYAYPRLRLEITCGSGTYIRSLGRDLAAAVGSGAVMASLARTAIGDFRLDHACPADALTAETLDAHLLPARLAVAELPALCVQDDQIRRLRHGLTIQNPEHLTSDEIAAVDSAGNLIAILTGRRGGTLGPVRNFATATQSR